ncbi:hypothetical protein HZA38_03270 [Candidatus Peregrinibacteria bacterium]|nr:hypothetical protein [Candidatus Peregrinibacteria bacterium]
MKTIQQSIGIIGKYISRITPSKKQSISAKTSIQKIVEKSGRATHKKSINKIDKVIYFS